MARAMPKKRSVPEQIIEDVEQGGREIIRQGKVAVSKIKSGAKKVKDFLSK